MAMIEINLLPREMRRRTGALALPRAALIGVGVAAIFGGALIGLTLMQTWRYARVNAAIERARERADGMRDDIAVVDRLTTVKSSIMRRLEAIELLDRDRGDWVRNLEDVAAVIPDYLWLTSFRRDEMKAKPDTKGKGAAVDSSAAPVRNDYVLEGYCYSISSLANMILNMQDSPRFSHVGLRRAQFTDVQGRRVYQFAAVCSLEPVDHSPEGVGDQGTPTKLSELPAEDVSEPISNRDEEHTGEVAP
ncbi:MAG: PilN domain-containing protein [Candidatus Zixiibacteriota bacterium]